MAHTPKKFRKLKRKERMMHQKWAKYWCKQVALIKQNPIKSYLDFYAASSIVDASWQQLCDPMKVGFYDRVYFDARPKNGLSIKGAKMDYLRRLRNGIFAGRLAMEHKRDKGHDDWMESRAEQQVNMKAIHQSILEQHDVETTMVRLVDISGKEPDRFIEMDAEVVKGAIANIQENQERWDKEDRENGSQ